MNGDQEQHMPGPFGRASAKTRSRILRFGGAATVLLFIALAIIDGRITAEDGPGIIALEVAGDPARASEILGQWGSGGIDWARISLLVDFPFLIAYGVFSATACTVMGPRLKARSQAGGAGGRIARHLAPLAPALGWAFVGAAIFDLVENIALLRVITFDLSPWALMAQVMASLKFAILGAGIPYLLAAVAVTATRSAKRR